MPGQLFGTDGVRGRAGDFLTAELALKLARAAVGRWEQPSGSGADGADLSGRNGRAQVVIVRDTRESGEMLESAIAAGVTAAGGDALLAGVLPTPAAPLLVRRHQLALAAVISASHNPFEDNGIKLFAADGFKLDDDTEHEIEAALEQIERRDCRAIAPFLQKNYAQKKLAEWANNKFDLKLAPEALIGKLAR